MARNELQAVVILCLVLLVPANKRDLEAEENKIDEQAQCSNIDAEKFNACEKKGGVSLLEVSFGTDKEEKAVKCSGKMNREETASSPAVKFKKASANVRFSHSSKGFVISVDQHVA